MNQIHFSDIMFKKWIVHVTTLNIQFIICNLIPHIKKRDGGSYLRRSPFVGTSLLLLGSIRSVLLLNVKLAFLKESPSVILIVDPLGKSGCNTFGGFTVCIIPNLRSTGSLPSMDAAVIAVSVGEL